MTRNLRKRICYSILNSAGITSFGLCPIALNNNNVSSVVSSMFRLSSILYVDRVFCGKTKNNRIDVLSEICVN